MTDPSDMEATVKRVQDLSAQVVDKAKENGLAWLEGYERMLKNFLDLEEQAAKGSGMEWIGVSDVSPDVLGNFVQRLAGEVPVP